MEAYREGIVPVSIVSGSEPSRPRRIACGVWWLVVIGSAHGKYRGSARRWWNAYPLPGV
jgi:hypothetical protein